MGNKQDRSKDRIWRRRAEPPYRQVRRKNLNRLGETVLSCMDVAGETPLPAQWQPMIDQIYKAYNENPELLIVGMWRVLCNFVAAEEQKAHKLIQSNSPTD